MMRRKDADNWSPTTSAGFDTGKEANLWRSEKTPLLTAKEKEAKILGAKRMTEKRVSVAVNALIVHDSPEHPWSWQRKLKVVILTLMCILFTVFLLILPEAWVQTEIVSVSQHKPLVYDLDKLYIEHEEGQIDTVLRVTLLGHFLSGVAARSIHELDYLEVTVQPENITRSNLTSLPEPWCIWLSPPWYSEAHKMHEMTHQFNILSLNLENENATLTIFSTSRTPTPLSVQLELRSSLVNIDVILGALILVVLYILIIFEVAHRTVISMLMATAAISILALLDERPSLEAILTWIDIETLTLLFSMMIMVLEFYILYAPCINPSFNQVSILSETGVFNYLGFWSFKVTKGSIWPLLSLLCFLTATISAVLDNVTTILLMTPVIIQLCEAISVDPVRVLIANVIFSNIGGALTPIGDPPNVLIASDPTIQACGVTFGAFTLHMACAVIPVLVVSYWQLRYMYSTLSVSNEEKELNDLQREIKIWHRSAQSVQTMTREEIMVKNELELKSMELCNELEERERMLESSHTSPRKSMSTILSEEMEANCKITDKPLLIKSVCVLTVTVILFFMSNMPNSQLSLGWIALIGALTLLVLSDKLEVESIFSRVEWSTLVFFATLFVIMEALKRLNFLKFIGNGVESIIESVPQEWQLTAAIMLILWVSGIASAFIDNIPFTTMMIPVIINISESKHLHLPLQPLVWSLALGACLGGNGTLIGASANVVCAGTAEQHGYKFTFKDFFLVGMPITIMSLLVANIYLLICHVAFEWNG